MSQKSIIIIGGGLAGLAAGCYARMNGYDVQIFEQHSLPGGVCTAWERKGYTIDGCIHWLMDALPGGGLYSIYEEVGALDGNRLIPLSEYGCLKDELSGRQLHITADLERLERDMRILGAGDADSIAALLAGVRALRGFKMDAPKPAELESSLERLKTAWALRHLAKIAKYQTVQVQEFTANFQDPFLRWGITQLFVPEMPALFLFALLAQLAEGRLAVIAGGSQRFAAAIARKYTALGGAIACSAEVEHIMVENDKAVGVRLADGTMHRADVVISAADGHSTLFNLLGGRYVDRATHERYANWPLFQPIVMVTFGVKREFPGEPAANIIRLKQPFSIGNRKVDAMWCRLFNYDPTLAPAGKTVVQVTAETDYESWKELREENPSRYRAAKERVAAEVLTRLEVHYPGLGATVEMSDVATPVTFWRYTRNYRGAYEGWLMSVKTAQTRIKKTLPGLDNFYMAGQWVEPGGGIPPALYSGRNAIWLLCRREGKRFIPVE